MKEMTQDFLFSQSCHVRLSGDPCLSCQKAEQGEPCDTVMDCEKHRLFLRWRKEQAKRITRANDRNMLSICHSCPVSSACPVSFEEPFSFCPVKRGAINYLIQNRFSHS